MSDEESVADRVARGWEELEVRKKAIRLTLLDLAKEFEKRASCFDYPPADGLEKIRLDASKAAFLEAAEMARKEAEA